MTVRFLTVSYTASWRGVFPDYCCLPFCCRRTIGSSVLVTCTSICATVWRDISLITSALATEDIWMEAEHARVFVFNSRGLSRGIFVFTNISLVIFPDDTLRRPILLPIWISCDEVNILLPVLHHPRSLRLILDILQFGIWVITIGLVVG